MNASPYLFAALLSHSMSYYISPRFLDKVAIHITKNFLDLPGVKVPLILGVHGRKGEGKSFQCELVFEHLGIEPVRMSAGELESPDAGDPVRLLKARYREAAELIKVRGKMCVLLINDLDAGAGRVDKGTQYTVNTQLVNGTLMNIADNPTDVQLPGSYDTQPIHRVPIIVTGNDFSTLYAPLVRDGRMEKFYWEPNREDRIGIVGGIFEHDGLTRQQVEQLLDTFSDQSVDFFGALRSRVYDEQVRAFIQQVGLQKVSTYLVNNPGTKIELQRVDFGLDRLIELGHMMVEEQHRLKFLRLADEYVGGATPPHPQKPELAQPAYQAPSSGNGQTNWLQASSSPSNGGYSASAPAQPSGNGLADGKLAQMLERGIRQGGRLTLEVANKREKSRNSWRTWSWKTPPQNAAQASEQIQACIQENPDHFVKLVGYNPKTQTRTMEELVARP